ncbi:MAG: hypothetical protein CSB55_03250 [Candidatus Cloacimonadota bacterium]|nr:MAG: hypothetical protein CSB55_03250 [Candidatus Cloacimonadota bacterium]
MSQNSSEPIDTGLIMGRKIGRSPDSRYIVSRKGTSVYNTVDGSVMNFNNFKGRFFNFCSEHRFTAIVIVDSDMFYNTGEIYLYDIKTGESSMILNALYFCQTGNPDEVIKINTVEE